jgi:hypothetical protein
MTMRLWWVLSLCAHARRETQRADIHFPISHCSASGWGVRMDSDFQPATPVPIVILVGRAIMSMSSVIVIRRFRSVEVDNPMPQPLSPLTAHQARHVAVFRRTAGAVRRRKEGEIDVYEFVGGLRAARPCGAVFAVAGAGFCVCGAFVGVRRRGEVSFDEHVDFGYVDCAV